MGRSRAIAALLAGALTLAPMLVGAQPKSADRQAAGDLVKKAIAKSQSGDHQAAIDLYLQAYAIVPQPLLLSNVGSEFQQANKPVEALKYFCKYLEADPTGTNVTYATAQAQSLQIQLGHKVDPADVCKPVQEAPPPDTGSGSGSDAGSGAGSGSDQTVTGTTGLAQTQPAPPEKPSRGLFYAGIGVGGAGLVATGIGIMYGLKAKSISDKISNHNVADQWPQDIQAQEAEGQRDEDRQIAFMIGGGVAVAAGAVMTFLGLRSSSSGEHQVTVTPTAGGGTVGLSIGGGF